MRKIDPVKAIKFATSVVIGAGTTTIVHQIISSNVEKDSVKEQVTVPVASLAIGGMVAEATQRYTDAKIDEIVNYWHTQIKPKLQK